MESEKEKMIGVCCHDAGGANQLLALISAEDLNVASAFMEGPAINLWGQMFPEKKLCSNLEEIFDKTGKKQYILKQEDIENYDEIDIKDSFNSTEEE